MEPEPLPAEDARVLDAEDPSEAQAHQPVRRMQQSHEWKASSKSNHPGPGAWQATCKYHAQSATVRCTKTLTVLEQGMEGETLALVKQWCIQASLHTRKDTHYAYNPRVEARLAPAPPEQVVTDEQQDAVDIDQALRGIFMTKSYPG